MEISYFRIEVSELKFCFCRWKIHFNHGFSPVRRYNDVDQATNAKIQIEQKQRDEAQMRKENNESWQPRVSEMVFQFYSNVVNIDRLEENFTM